MVCRCGSLTKNDLVEVILDNKVGELTIWSVAPLFIIHMELSEARGDDALDNC